MDEDPTTPRKTLRNPTGTSVRTEVCRCGAQKGQARWARLKDGKPVGAKCFECGSTAKWKQDAGYTHATSRRREVKKTSIKTIKGMVEAMRKSAADRSLDERLADIDAILAEVDIDETLDEIIAGG